jgi:hypothetical protein
VILDSLLNVLSSDDICCQLFLQSDFSRYLIAQGKISNADIKAYGEHTVISVTPYNNKVVIVII